MLLDDLSQEQLTERQRYWLGHIRRFKEVGGTLAYAMEVRTIFTNIPAAQSLEDFEKLLPWNIQAPPRSIDSLTE